MRDAAVPFGTFHLEKGHSIYTVMKAAAPQGLAPECLSTVDTGPVRTRPAKKLPGSPVSG
jgi:hypothetical protein